MAKQAKTVKDTPEIYIGLVSNPENLRKCLMEDVNLNLSMFDSRAQLEGLTSYEALIKPTIGFVWDNFSTFCDAINEQTALARHEQLFGANPPKKQDLITTKLHVWHKLCANVKTNMCTTGTPKDPVTQRKSAILNCKYMPGEITEGSADIKTYQALRCLDLFRECLDKREEVSEGELKQYVLDHAERLRTRQDPWRIFQYYRPQLIAAKLIRRP